MNVLSQLDFARHRLREMLADGVSSNEVETLLFLGAELDRGGDREAALGAYESVAANVSGNHPALWNTIATLYFTLGRPKAALQACNEGLRLAPDDPDTLFNTAVVLEFMNERTAAALLYKRTLEINETHFGALLNLVSLMLAERRPEEALKVSEAAIRIHSGDADCWFNHGEVMTTFSRHDEALASYEKALSLQPDLVKADIAAAVSEAAIGHLELSSKRLNIVAKTHPPALANFHSPLETDRVSAYPELEPGRIALIAAYQRYRLCDWSSRNKFIDLFTRVIDGHGCKPMDNPDLPFFGIGLPISGEYRLRAATQVARRIATTSGGPPLVRSQRDRRQRLRIAYISGDFRQHATAYLMNRLPGLHDRSNFEVFVYSSGPDDESSVRHEIISGADTFCDIAHFDAHSTAQRIAMDGIDILVDLSGYTLYTCAAALALRPAPVQVSYLAYLQTMGAPWIDYALLDHIVLKESERPNWRESIAYLPHTLYPCDDRRTMSTAPGNRVEAGLPEETFVFCCLSAPWKIDPDTFSIWMTILSRVPKSILWLYCDMAEARKYLLNAARCAGIAPERLVFASHVSHAEHLTRFRHADVFLDTFLCNAHTTCIEALAAGVAVVTLPGETVVSRVAASLISAHGVPELVARNQTEYVETACRLATDPPFLSSIRQKVADQKHSKLFCTDLRVRELELAYQRMWARHQSGLPPTDFDCPEVLSSAST